MLYDGCFDAAALAAAAQLSPELSPQSVSSALQPSPHHAYGWAMAAHGVPQIQLPQPAHYAQQQQQQQHFGQPPKSRAVVCAQAVPSTSIVERTRSPSPSDAGGGAEPDVEYAPPPAEESERAPPPVDIDYARAGDEAAAPTEQRSRAVAPTPLQQLEQLEQQHAQQLQRWAKMPPKKARLPAVPAQVLARTPQCDAPASAEYAAGFAAGAAAAAAAAGLAEAAGLAGAVAQAWDEVPAAAGLETAGLEAAAGAAWDEAHAVEDGGEPVTHEFADLESSQDLGSSSPPAQGAHREEADEVVPLMSLFVDSLEYDVTHDGRAVSPGT